MIHKVYIPGMRDFQGFNWVVTAKVAHLTGFEKYQSHIVVGCLLFYCVIILSKEVILCYFIEGYMYSMCLRND